MKILTMNLENFRQFYGKQSLEFASEDKNMTIIFGENGKGKTGIFRALIFALYNATHIQQDNPSEKIHLVNLRLLDDHPGTPCKASVTVRFEHKDRKSTRLNSSHVATSYAVFCSKQTTHKHRVADSTPAC